MLRATGLATQPRGDLVIERHVYEVIVSFLAGCTSRRSSSPPPCLAADLGANNGWMSAFMLALGAHVVSVEPQSDLAHAISETAALNCWAARSKVINAFAVAGTPDDAIRRPAHRAWRWGFSKVDTEGVTSNTPMGQSLDLREPHSMSPAATSLLHLPVAS